MDKMPASDCACHGLDELGAKRFSCQGRFAQYGSPVLGHAINDYLLDVSTAYNRLSAASKGKRVRCGGVRTCGSSSRPRLPFTIIFHPSGVEQQGSGIGKPSCSIHFQLR